MNEPDKPHTPLGESLHHAAEALLAKGVEAGAAAVELEQAAEQALEKQLEKRPYWRTVLSVAGWALVSAYFLFAVLVLSLRYWVLPNIGRYTEVIESSVSRVVGERVTIGAVSAGWDGLRPELDLTDLRIVDGSGQTVLALPAVEAVLSWASLAVGSVNFHSLTIDKPDLAVRRDAAGALYVAGLRIKSEEDGQPGFSDWLLAQRELSVRGARIVWTDEQRGAPPLDLSGVSLVLQNSGDTHRFALRAAVPRELAAALDVRGELIGQSLARPEQWSGKVYAELEYIDLDAWRRWLDYPVELKSGDGGLRLWVDFAQSRLTRLTADVALAGVALRAAKGLPMLELDFLHGRLGASQGTLATEIFGKQLSLRTKGGVALPPAEFALRLQKSREEGEGRPEPARGEFSADALELRPLAQLAEFLPFPEAMRKRLDAADPRGSVHELKLSWQGPLEQPAEYSLKGRFNALAMRAHDKLPGFSGLAGTVSATQRGGSLSLATPRPGILSRSAAKNVLPPPSTLELPALYPDRPLRFDVLSGQVAWSFSDDAGLEIRLADVAFANVDGAGTLAGTVLAKPGSQGVVDLTASLTRADARAVWSYFPATLSVTRDYLRGALIAGQSRDVQLRLKGDLAQFPFEDNKAGRFLVTVKIADGELAYAPGWPRISGIAGDLVIEGKRLAVQAQRGSILGARLSNVRAVIPDLVHHDEQLAVEGQADGPTTEFLGFLDNSPLAVTLDGVTRDMRATGNGRLSLKLDLPLRRLEATRVAGSFQFQNNQVTFDPELPPLAQVNGRLDFTEAGVTVRSVTAQFLGGPITVNAQTREGIVGIDAQGTAAVAMLRKLGNVPLLEHASGVMPWRGSASARRGGALDLMIESTLQGVVIDLPPPFGKNAVEAMPLRLARSNNTDAETVKRFGGLRAPPKGDVVALSLGSPGRSLSVLAARRAEGRSYVIDRASVAINETATAPAQAGIAVSGSLPYLDVDRWQSAMAGPASSSPGSGVAAAGPGGLGMINVKVAALDFAGKRINNLSLRALPSGPQWNASVDARELKGEVRWRPEGRGLVQARLSHLISPEDRPAAPGAASPAPEQSRELPALDIVADSFTLKDKALGRLELVAVNDTRDWRIEKLVLSNPESTLRADGVWQSWAARPSTSVNIHLETSDLGKYLERMGYPRIMERGSARLDGKVGWIGSPQSPDFATLSGNISLTADRGQFLKADPGVAKLLGVLSLQSLVTLDLRDLFREGFSYDTINGTAALAKGVMTTSDFIMRGASAQVVMSGSIDLAKETQNLHLRVVPSLGAGASTITAAILANPLLGLGATIVSRLLKDPLGQIFAAEYDVTGSWDDPKVTKTGSGIEDRKGREP